MKQPQREVQVESSSHTIAIAQARAFAAQAQALGGTIKVSRHSSAVGNQIAFLVIVGLTLELYFKAFMIRGRGGRVTLGHDLAKLLAEFPLAFRDAFTAEYDRRNQSLKKTYINTAILISKDPPLAPEGDGPALRFDSFDVCIAALSDAFVRFRYLFEDISPADWTYIPYPNHYALAAIQTMETVYVRFENGEFKGRLPKSSN